MRQQRKGNILEVDLHGMTADEAKRSLERLLSSAPPAVKEVVVIHGYYNGTVLQEMVRTKLKHPRIASKMLSLNPGATRLILK
ncbi:MAG: Smr/MutS family protein [Oscillospiraceae bacterium]|nr:Smr/MutS family protein [Oscillospiraceae bacterium]